MMLLKNRTVGTYVSEILLETCKIVRDLFVIKLSTSKWLICLLTYQYLDKITKIRDYRFYESFIPFIKSLIPYPCYFIKLLVFTKYQYIMNNSALLLMIDLLFPLWCG